MRLVPRQLRRYGMTGDVPYYGGRFTPAQAHAISHPQQPMPTTSVPSTAPVPVPGPAPDPEVALGACSRNCSTRA